MHSSSSPLSRNSSKPIKCVKLSFPSFATYSLHCQLFHCVSSLPVSGNNVFRPHIVLTIIFFAEQHISCCSCILTLYLFDYCAVTTTLQDNTNPLRFSALCAVTLLEANVHPRDCNAIDCLLAGVHVELCRWPIIS